VIDRATLGRLAVAAAASAAAHVALVVYGRIDLPGPPESLPPLAVRIVEEPRPPAQAVTPPFSAVRRPHYARTEPLRVAPARPQPLSLAASATTDEPETTAAADLATLHSEPVPVASDTVPPSEADVPPRSLPARGHIAYDLVYGPDHFRVGRTIQVWQTDGARYVLSSRSETIGLLDVIRSQHRTFLSRGSITSEGLRPETFLMSRNRGRGIEEARASFDWPAASVTLQGAARERHETLPARTQDLLSFIYQLALHPPPQGRFRQSLTNGARIETYEIEVLAEEIIETRIGTLRAVPVRQIRKGGAESIELWLAPEYRYMPVRIRFLSREGEPQGEQIVTEIRLSEDTIAQRNPNP
jgi:hypothetical protein